jgi:tetratricopeptide (TPR) repeat protein
VRAESGDLAGARRDFEQVIARDPQGNKSDRVLAARVELAHLRSRAGEYQDALADCDAVLAARPDFPEAHRQRAEVLLGLERNKEAGAALDQYLKVGGKPTARALRARGLLHAQQHEYRAAVAAYSQSLVLEEDAETLSDRAWAYLAQEAVRPALDDFDAALKLNPQEADAWAGRATALINRGRPTDVGRAIADAEKSLALRNGRKTSPQLMVCVRIYTRAAGLLEAVPQRPGNDATAVHYLRRAVVLLREAMESMPRKDRPTYWRKNVLDDPVLRPLQRNPLPGMRELHYVYGR